MLSDLIKEKTENLHELAEAKFGSKKIFGEGYSVADYKEFIAENYRLVSVLEPIIGLHLPGDFASAINYSNRRKLDYLVKDAEILGIPKIISNDLHIPAGPFTAIGMLYVLEGASLGGNVIKKRLQRTEGFENIQFNYLGMYGEAIGKNWSEFLMHLNQLPAKRYDAIIRGAETAYEVLLSSKAV